MKERPIIFQGEMVRAILDGRKTQTRRVVKDTGFYAIDPAIHGQEVATRELKALATQCPYGAPSDRLWVRETFTDEAGGIWPYLGDHIYYRADPLQPMCERWTPSILMPRWASRITLEITGVRVERLQDISEADAKSEGAEPAECCHAHYHGFSKLWESINGKGSWDVNPWVWVINFERVQS